MNTQQHTASSQNNQSIGSEPSPSVLNSPISILNLSIRALNCLQSVGITTVLQLVEMVENNIDRLRHIRNMGEKSILNIISSLNEFDLKLAVSTQSGLDGKLKIRSPGAIEKQAFRFKRMMEAHKLYTEKGTLEVAGKHMGITRERVRQLLETGTRHGLFEYKPYNYPFVPKEKILDDYKKFLNLNDVASANNITAGYLHKLLTAYNITEENISPARIERHKLNCIDKYNRIKNKLGHHPTTTELQSTSDGHALHNRIIRLWGSIDTFRELLNIPKPPQGSQSFREDTKQWREHKQQVALIRKMQQLDMIRECLGVSGLLSTSQIASECNIGIQRTYGLLQLLMATKKVEREGHGACVNYRLMKGDGER